MTIIAVIVTIRTMILAHCVSLIPVTPHNATTVPAIETCLRQFHVVQTVAPKRKICLYNNNSLCFNCYTITVTRNQQSSCLWDNSPSQSTIVKLLYFYCSQRTAFLSPIATVVWQRQRGRIESDPVTLSNYYRQDLTAANDRDDYYKQDHLRRNIAPNHTIKSCDDLPPLLGYYKCSLIV